MGSMSCSDTVDLVDEWEPQIWMGVSVENKDYLYRIDDLRATGAQVKFLSIEPLLGPLPKLNLRGIDWVIVGGESGPGARPMQPDWVRQIRDQCLRANVPFFFKQWGGPVKSKTGRILDGRTWDEMPGGPTTPIRSVPYPYFRGRMTSQVIATGTSQILL